MEEVLGACVERSIRSSSNAGGLNPAGLAAELERARGRARHPGAHRARRGRRPPAAPRRRSRRAASTLRAPRHRASRSPRSTRRSSPRTRTSARGASSRRSRAAPDVVICPRVTDAALTLGPAAWQFGWARDDWDRLAGAASSPGTSSSAARSATGGNYSFFREVPGHRAIGFPIAEMHADGIVRRSRSTPARAAASSVGTVTAQLLYEIEGRATRTPT